MNKRFLRMTVAAGAVLVAGFATLGLAQQTVKPGPVEKKIVLIKGTQAWVPTGFMLQAGDRVTLNSAGKVCFSSGDPQSCPGPSGWPRSGPSQVYAVDWPDDANMCDDPLGNANHAMVIAKVGNGVFPAGASLTFTGKAGLLAVGINDCSFTGPANTFFNTGEYSVVITVQRAK